jgi:hypothetical protein
VRKALLPQLDLGLVPHRSLLQVVLASRIGFVDFGLGGPGGIVVQPVGIEAGCGGTGNCPLWVFRKTGSIYSLILRSEGETFQTLQPVGGAWPDILVGTNNSGSERTLRLYHFSKGFYSEKACYQAGKPDVR